MLLGRCVLLTTGSDAALKEKRARTVRLNDLPEGVQEALLQQALEKVVPVRRLELFTKTRHALAELNSEAVSSGLWNELMQSGRGQAAVAYRTVHL